MKAGRTHAAMVLGVAVLGASLAGCDWGGDDDPEWPPPATKILEVRVDPNPVVAGDTTTFTCVVSDSLDADLEFSWELSDINGSGVTSTNTFQWVADVERGTYTHQVIVSRLPGAGYEVVGESFQVEVIAPE